MTREEKLKQALALLQSVKDMSPAERVELYRSHSEEAMRALGFNDLASMLSTMGEHKCLRASLLAEALRSAEHVSRVETTIRAALAALPVREEPTRKALTAYLGKLSNASRALCVFVNEVGFHPEVFDQKQRK